MCRLAFPSDDADVEQLGAETILNVRVVRLSSWAAILRATILSDLARIFVTASCFMPTSFYVDRSGNVVNVQLGLTSKDDMEANIRKTLGEGN